MLVTYIGEDKANITLANGRKEVSHNEVFDVRNDEGDGLITAYPHLFARADEKSMAKVANETPVVKNKSNK